MHVQRFFEIFFSGGGGGGMKTEMEREKGRIKPTHLEEKRQKESMTAQHNEIW